MGTQRLIFVHEWLAINFSRKVESGKDVNYKFCGTCDTTLCIEATIANIYSVAAATLVGQKDLSLKMAIYTESAPSWAVFPEGVPKFAKLPPGLGS